MSLESAGFQPPAAQRRAVARVMRLDPARGLRLNEFWLRLKQRKLVQWAIA
jgi:hypothetical protein